MIKVKECKIHGLGSSLPFKKNLAVQQVVQDRMWMVPDQARCILPQGDYHGYMDTFSSGPVLAVQQVIYSLCVISS